MAERRKSKLQKYMEEEGWEFQGNVPQTKTGDINLSLKERDSEIRQEYRKRGFENVYVGEAYDLFGVVIPECRAVYIL